MNKNIMFQKFNRYIIEFPLNKRKMGIPQVYLTEDLRQSSVNLYKKILESPSVYSALSNVKFPMNFIKASSDYFDEIKRKGGRLKVDKSGMADRYFENFTPLIGLVGGEHKRIWYKIWKIVYDWEKDNNYKLHKGTLFYFWATANILTGNDDEGMILMHRALKEDRRKDSDKSRNPDTPANTFISMDESKGQFLQEITKEMYTFVIKRFDRYKGNITKNDLRSKFLLSSRADLEDVRYLFSWVVLKTIRLRTLHKARDLADGQMSTIILLNTISKFLLIIDEVFKIILNRFNSKTFANHIFYYLKTKGQITDANTGCYLGRILPKLSDRFSDEFLRNNPVIFKGLLNNKFIDTNGNKVSKLESQLLLCYCLRNFTAHKIKGIEIFWKPKIFTDLLQVIFNTFFLVVEEL